MCEEKIYSKLKEIKGIDHPEVSDFRCVHINQPFGRYVKKFLDISWSRFYNAEIILFLCSFNITEICITINLISIYVKKIAKKYFYTLQDYIALWKFC